MMVGCKQDGPAVNTLNADGTLNWLTIQTAEQASNPDGKLFIVDMYTEWCAWCKRMDQRTFSDPEVQAYLDEHFYVVKMDAETKESQTFKGKTYDWQPGGRNGINQLAMELMDGRQSYPAMVYLDQDLNKIELKPGFKRADQFMDDLRSIVEKAKGKS
jgi:thioredoxin-related protein